MKRRALILGAASLPLSIAIARAAEPVPPLLQQVRERLTPDPVVRGSFEQRKTIKGFRNPLVSTGTFVVARKRGVLWRTQVPFASTLIVTEDRVLARQADGSVTRRLSAGDEPAVRALGETLLGVMAADLSVLAQRFRIEGELVGRDAWHLQLAARDPAMARWVQHVALEGDRFLRLVRLAEGSGDLTQIRLSGHATDHGLSAEEGAQFE